MTRSMVVGVLVISMGSVAAAPASTQHVHITGITFDPREVDLLPGDTVQWDNHATIIHTVTDRTCLTGGPCEFDEELSPNEVFEVTFPDSGVFLYQCRIHGFSAQLRVADAPGTLPDLAIDSISWKPATIAGVPVPTTTRIETVVANEGTASSPASRLRVEYRYRNRWHPIDDIEVTPLSPGATATVNVLWDTSHMVGDVVVRAVTDPADEVEELRPSNNTASVTASLVTPPGAVPGLDLLAPLG